MISCVICKEGTYNDGTTTVTLERGATIVVIKSVPAQGCSNCGEYLLPEEVTDHIMNILDIAVRQGAALEMINYAA
jgi:YgiT-type zinc finger domain-containing protein